MIASTTKNKRMLTLSFCHNSAGKHKMRPPKILSRPLRLIVDTSQNTPAMDNQKSVGW